MNALQAFFSPEIIIPVVSILMPVFIVAIVFYFRHQKLQLQHETIQKMLAKDLPIPPELFNAPSEAWAENSSSIKKSTQTNASIRLHRALTMVGVGAGLLVFFRYSDFPSILCWTGAIPLAIGLAQLLGVFLEPLVSKR
jgi:Na+/H+ antiporter NhaC